MITILLAAALASSLVAGAILMRDNLRLHASCAPSVRPSTSWPVLPASRWFAPACQSPAAPARPCQETRRLAN